MVQCVPWHRGDVYMVVNRFYPQQSGQWARSRNLFAAHGGGRSVSLRPNLWVVAVGTCGGGFPPGRPPRRPGLSCPATRSQPSDRVSVPMSWSIQPSDIGRMCFSSWGSPPRSSLPLIRGLATGIGNIAFFSGSPQKLHPWDTFCNRKTTSND